MDRYQLDEEVYFTGYLRGKEEIFYLCKGKIIQLPLKKERLVFKVSIIGVATHSVGNKTATWDQSILLGKTITKKLTELHKTIPEFMKPDAWIGVTKGE